MLSYRHGFHAGNFADLQKHLTLALVIGHLTQKPGPIRYIDTHAGAGVYDIASPMAAKTGEYLQGAGAVNWSLLPAPAAGFRNLVTELAGDHRYPGSPMIAARMLRPVDELRLFEVHTSEVPGLKRLFARDRRAQVNASDGFQALKSQLPFRGGRAIVLMDPAYETLGDYHAVVDAVSEGIRRMATAVIIVWYPILDGKPFQRLSRQLQQLAPKSWMACEWRLANPTHAMAACGVMVLNPPWTLESQLKDCLAALSLQLGATARFSN